MCGDKRLLTVVFISRAGLRRRRVSLPDSAGRLFDFAVAAFFLAGLLLLTLRVAADFFFFLPALLPEPLVCLGPLNLPRSASTSKRSKVSLRCVCLRAGGGDRRRRCIADGAAERCTHRAVNAIVHVAQGGETHLELARMDVVPAVSGGLEEGRFDDEERVDVERDIDPGFDQAFGGRGAPKVGRRPRPMAA